MAEMETLLIGAIGEPHARAILQAGVETRMRYARYQVASNRTVPPKPESQSVKAETQDRLPRVSDAVTYCEQRVGDGLMEIPRRSSSASSLTRPTSGSTSIPSQSDRVSASRRRIRCLRRSRRPAAGHGR